MRHLFCTTFLTVAMLSASCAADSPVVRPPKGQVYVFESDASGFNTKTVFYDDGQQVVAFDAQFTEGSAEQAIAFLKQQTSHPIKYLIVTHPNPDKFLGVPAFKKVGATVIMSQETAQHMPAVYDYKKYYFVNIAKSFTDSSFPKPVTADKTFADTYTIPTAGGGTVELRELHQAGISSNQTVAYIKQANLLIVGDLVHHRVHAWLEGPIVEGKAAYQTQPWVNALRRLQKEYPATARVYGGRGEAAPAALAFADQIRYLTQAETITRSYVESLPGNSLADKKAKVDYATLTKAFEREFPGYGLSYMISYGAYGLVNSL
ncbi:MBL fold metallo-hydrolase [Hymenobacter sp. BT664]|uniref:MBL fold metallo-hydrolase n=1 Tax=Hymenobacter montanus TaxID=2771359 RepID=A0A927BFP3_9BACT|nr:MBL fold metallo-hydrolase [Hymenobacter montanus]MBD2770017.1 MBL fold metallo-hydrolase [Hymenobacter montanus]